MPVLLQVARKKSTAGFSIIELVAVIVLLAILGVVALGRIGDMKGYESLGFFNETVNALRYAQKLAVSTGCRVQARITSSGWQLWQGDACNSANYALPVADPAQRNQAYARNAPAGVVITPATTLIFTPQSTVEGVSSDPRFTIADRSFQVYRHSGLIDAL